MRKIFLLIIVGLMVITSNAQNKLPLNLGGTTKGVTSGMVYLQKFNNKMFYTIDSARITNGKFAFNTKVELPELYGLSLDTLKETFYIFLDNNPVTVMLSPDYSKTVAKGSKLQDLFVSYKAQENVEIDKFIRQHPASLVSAYVLYRDFSYRLTPEEIKSNLQLLDTSLYKTPYVQVLNNLIGVLEKVAVGKKVPDFTALDPQGKPLKLYDFLGKSYLLIDFWASWCGPCRRENPNVVKVYQKYKDKGFDVFAVSLDKDKERWIKAIRQDNLAWNHVSDLLFWNSEPAKLYGVRAIPSNFLVDSNGIIVARNVMGEDLDKLLEKLFNK